MKNQKTAVKVKRKRINSFSSSNPFNLVSEKVDLSRFRLDALDLTQKPSNLATISSSEVLNSSIEGIMPKRSNKAAMERLEKIQSREIKRMFRQNLVSVLTEKAESRINHGVASELDYRDLKTLRVYETQPMYREEVVQKFLPTSNEILKDPVQGIIVIPKNYKKVSSVELMLLDVIKWEGDKPTK